MNEFNLFTHSQEIIFGSGSILRIVEIANSDILPHAVRFKSDVAALELAQVARSINLNKDRHDTEDAAEIDAVGVYTFNGQLDLPQRLRDIGIAESDLSRLAELAMQSHAVQTNPESITDVAQTDPVLRAAW